MKLKKLLLQALFSCAVVLLIAFVSITYGGWSWQLPEDVVARFNFERLTENTERLQADGYGEISSPDSDEYSQYLYLGVLNEHTNPVVVIMWYPDVPTPKVSATAVTRAQWGKELLPDGLVKLGYHFVQKVEIWDNNGSYIVIEYFTKTPIGGRQEVIDFLNEFCDNYCSKS